MKEIACIKYEEMLKKQRQDLLRQIDKWILKIEIIYYVAFKVKIK